MIARRRPAKAVKRLGVKRVYEPPSDDDGLRILVDRLWPRGLTKAKARVDWWLKDIAPSDELRHRFHGEPTKWKEFVAAYGRELKREPAKTAAANLLERLRREPATTLLYASRDDAHNNALALKHWLQRRLRK